VLAGDDISQLSLRDLLQQDQQIVSAADPVNYDPRRHSRFERSQVKEL
jgi:hypothetical protein